MEKIKKLRNQLNKYNLDGYLVPKNNEYFNEYIRFNEDDLRYITNFSGSFGLALICKKKNYLFVDGRYTIQANDQSGKFFKILTLPFSKKKYFYNFKNKRIGFDPNLFNEQTIKLFSKYLNTNLIAININLIKLIKNKSKGLIKKSFFYALDKSVVGRSFKAKLNDLKKYLNKNLIDVMLITSSENVAWLLNIRGNDSDYSPIPNSFLLIDEKKKVYLFCDLKKINKKFRINYANIKIFQINLLKHFLSNIKKKKFLIDKSTCSIFYKEIIERNNIIKKNEDPIYLLKSIKNNIELNNTKKIHEYDGAAFTKFIFWIKENFYKKKITEISAQEKLLKFKKRFVKFKSLSFPTISSTGSNAAIVHYNASKKTNKLLKKNNIYLVDSGGQYYFGTTDATRTISLNNENTRVKEIFTRVLKGHLNISNYKLKKNTITSYLDKLARKSLKEIKLDYSHGTGHGVGYFLNVHEGPQSISKFNHSMLKPGMIVSNEPGFYKKGEFGIRIENLIYVNKVNQKLKFSNLTFIPIDKDLILKKLLTKDEVSWLNNYHNLVFKKLKKYMNRKELILLKESCSNI